MKLVLRKRTEKRVNARLKNRVRIRRKIEGTKERPRLAVFRSGKNTYAQIIDDVNRVILASASTLKGSLKSGKNVDAAKFVGAEIAKKALAQNIKTVVFDRSGYLYHGRVKAIAESAREAGLEF
ncbi:MAG: 50S ribosomal protein L18 [Bdellovibrionales bacterium]|nr:50S ribosomal protein L18 [Bdellovibrionales bacterium]